MSLVIGLGAIVKGGGGLRLANHVFIVLESEDIILSCIGPVLQSWALSQERFDRKSVHRCVHFIWTREGRKHFCRIFIFIQGRTK